MNANELKGLQQPLKLRYTEDPTSAVAMMHAEGVVDFQKLSCHVVTPQANDAQTTAGLHPMAGGDGTQACSGDMLLQSLVACSGVTFAAVSTAMGLEITSAGVSATGQMDFRGTLAVDRETPVGFSSVELIFTVVSDEPDEKIDKLIQLTERYCVVLQTLQQGIPVTSRRSHTA